MSLERPEAAASAYWESIPSPLKWPMVSIDELRPSLKEQRASTRPCGRGWTVILQAWGVGKTPDCLGQGAWLTEGCWAGRWCLAAPRLILQCSVTLLVGRKCRPCCFHAQQCRPYFTKVHSNHLCSSCWPPSPPSSPARHSSPEHSQSSSRQVRLA